ncbi:hypothetical protein D9Q98_003385 [Chlorella vulgaris]|uniref:Uncharacterized protein n=1 Tax=Chlorella vulgaris TaxID=3077 RepID=A0A9D4TSF5_CHLVU|nr:hypothetical protein D9Q98_003385 [Chlorella vulgaris]
MQAAIRSLQGQVFGVVAPIVACRAARPGNNSHRPSQARRSSAVPRATGTERLAVTAFASVMAAAASNGGSVASSDRLLIVGPGVLGSYLGKLWMDEKGAGTVVGQTNSTTNHAKLQALGIAPRTKDAAAGGGTFPNVLFAAPPSGSADYVGEIKAALELWDGTGTFVFTSSAGLYTVEDGSACDESAPVAKPGDSERTDKLLAAEAAVIAAGGCVVRLVGLYHGHRGAHTFFLRQGEVARWAGYTVNLIHYEDAASLCLAALSGRGAPAGQPYRGRTFLGCDGSPVTFEDMMAATVATGAFEGSYKFTGQEGPGKGKRMSNAATRQQLQWEPKYASYVQFMQQTKAQDWYAQQELAVAGMPHA